MSIQTIATTTEVISQTIVSGGDDEPPPSNQHQNPQHIRDTFNIALGRAPGGPGGPGGPEGPRDPHRGPNIPGGIPPAYLIPIQPTGDLKPAGIPPLIFNRDRTHADAFIKGPQVDGWVEGILKGLKQLHPVDNNVKYTYLNFLAQFKGQFTDSTKQEVAQASLNHLLFCFPSINQYISNFKMLAQKARYTIGS